jgi:hypothetical protein
MGSEVAAVAPLISEVPMVEAEAVREMRELAARGWGAKRIARGQGGPAARAATWDTTSAGGRREVPGAGNVQAPPVKYRCIPDAAAPIDKLNLVDAGVALVTRNVDGIVLTPRIGLEWMATDHLSFAVSPRAEFMLGEPQMSVFTIAATASYAWFLPFR